MTLSAIVRDIERFGRAKLDMLGLTVHPIPSEFIDAEDDSIVFRDAAGRDHAVSLSVNSLAPSWNAVNLSHQHHELLDLPGTDVRGVRLGFSFPALRSATVGAKVAELLTYLRDNLSFVVTDDLESARTVTDGRFIKLVPLLLERFDGEVFFDRSTQAERVDIVKLVDDGGEEAVTVRLGMGDVWITYQEDDREAQLHYRNFPQFEENFPKDLPLRSVARRNGPRP